MYIGMIVIGGIFSLIGAYISRTLKSKFQKYSRLGNSSGMSGREIAQAMLQHYGVQGVKIVEAKGFLSDHYNPASRTVALSPAVYHGRNVSAAAVAAHECGHAVQHDTAYSMLQFRSGLVPIVKVAGSMLQFLLLASFLLFASFPQLMLVTIVLFALTTLFSFVTLPVEFDASRRALVWLDSSGVTATDEEYFGARDALKWAAMTYVAAALSSLVMLLYLVFRFVASD